MTSRLHATSDDGCFLHLKSASLESNIYKGQSPEYQAQHRSKMSGHADTQAVLERIQVSMMQGTTKQQSLLISSSSTVPEKGAETTDVKNIKVNCDISTSRKIWTSLIAGAIAGALAKTVIAPLDRTKINFQISKQRYTARDAFKFIMQSYSKDGLVSLWRGNSASMVRVMPSTAIGFMAHEQWKRILHVNTAEQDKLKSFIAGSLAGLTSQSTTYPLDFARARMAVTHKEAYRTLRQLFIKNYKEGGITTFYRGFTASMMGVMVYGGCSFSTYDTLKPLLAGYTVNNPSLSMAAQLVSGALAGAVGQTSSYPLDIVRRRMQTSAISDAHYRTIYSTIVKIYTEGGIMAFFKGLSMNWVKGPVSASISFATHDAIRDVLRKFLC